MGTTIASPSVMYARIFGVVLTIVGVIGLGVTTDQEAVRSLLGFDVNLTHNLVHLATGVLGLVAGFALLSWARAYAIAFGVVYTGLAVWGFVVGEGFNPFGLLGSVNAADNVLHLLIGLIGIGAGVSAVDRARDLA